MRYLALDMLSMLSYLTFVFKLYISFAHVFTVLLSALGHDVIRFLGGIMYVEYNASGRCGYFVMHSIPLFKYIQTMEIICYYTFI